MHKAKKSRQVHNNIARHSCCNGDHVARGHARRDKEITAYRMRSVIDALEVDHTIDAGERRASTLASMRVEFLLRKDIAASLGKSRSAITALISLSHKRIGCFTSHENDTMMIR